MVFRVYLLAVKSPELSLEEFKEEWDIHHINLLKEIAGDAYPDNHYHRYPKKVAGPEETNYDGIGYLEFDNKTAFLKLKEVTGIPENRARLDEHENKFLDKARCQLYIIDEDEG